jgi:hypothetical protein
LGNITTNASLNKQVAEARFYAKKLTKVIKDVDNPNVDATNKANKQLSMAHANEEHSTYQKHMQNEFA